MSWPEGALERSAEATRRAAKAPHGPCRVMLIDDSLVVRSILERMIGDMQGVELVLSASSAEAALAALARTRPDVIVLDIDLPGISGLVALPELLERAPQSRVLILSSNCPEGGPAAVEALALGASDTLCKPGRSIFAGTFGATFKARLLALGGRTDLSPDASLLCADLRPPPRPEPQNPIRLRAIGVAASTGGIPAFGRFLSHLDPHNHAPLFLTQHLPAAFMPYYAQQLSSATRRQVQVAEHGMAVRADALYLAPGTGHVQLVANGSNVVIEIIEGRQPSGCCPSADPMFASMATVYGGDCAAIVLSGMGQDGALGAGAVAAAGGLVLGQDPESCVVWGMPGAIMRAGIARGLLEPGAIAAYLNRSAVPAQAVRRGATQ